MCCFHGLARCPCIARNIKMHFFTKHLLWLTHAGVIPCVKTNDISRILSENGYLENVNEKNERWEIRWGGVEHGGDWWSEWEEAWGWTAPAGGSGHHARLFQRLHFLIAQNEVVGYKDEWGKALSVNMERGAGIFYKIIIIWFLSVRYRSNGL